MKFSIMVFGANLWPLKTSIDEFVIPAEILPIYNQFRRYYHLRHTGRRLKWLWNYSRTELHMEGLDKRYILMTNAYQAAVLLQYNSQDSLTLDSLVAATGIEKEVLSQVLAPLTKAKILISGEVGQIDINLSMRTPSTLCVARSCPIAS
jgi:cullin 1